MLAKLVFPSQGCLTQKLDEASPELLSPKAASRLWGKRCTPFATLNGYIVTSVTSEGVSLLRSRRLFPAKDILLYLARRCFWQLGRNNRGQTTEDRGPAVAKAMAWQERWKAERKVISYSLLVNGGQGPQRSDHRTTGQRTTERRAIAQVIGYLLLV